MKTTDTTERGLETLIVEALTTQGGYLPGLPADYDRALALDVPRLLVFLAATQPDAVQQFRLTDLPAERQKFLERLRPEISRRGVVEVLREGIKHGPATVQFYYPTPSAGNAAAAQRHAHNQWSVTRQVRYSLQNGNSVDVVVFLNGLPLLTMELKNSLTKQTVADAVGQYQHDRDPKERGRVRGVAHVQNGTSATATPKSCCFSPAAAWCIWPSMTSR